MTNKEIKALADKIERQLSLASNSEQVLAAVKLAVYRGRPLVYSHRTHYLLGGFALLIALPLVAALVFEPFSADFQSKVRASQGFFIFIAALSGILGAVLFYIAISRSMQLKRLADRAFRIDSLSDNGIKQRGRPSIGQMQSWFSEFDRGNHSREFKEALKGHYKGKLHNFDYDYLHFHYVDRRTETYTVSDSDGRTSTRTRTVYDRFDRYSLIVPFSYRKGVQVISFKLNNQHPVSWRPASAVFCRTFKVRAMSELEAVRFLKPSVIVAFESIAKMFKGLNVELSHDGHLCMSFKDSDVLSARRRFDFKNPKAFYKELEGKTTLLKLNAALSFVERLIRHSDKNF